MQISKVLGARVVAVTSGSDKVEYLKSLGADAVVDTAEGAARGQKLHKMIAAVAPKGNLLSYQETHDLRPPVI